MQTVLIKSDPPEVYLEDVEDFLATDDLFVEYFNVFLSLPTFPEPLCFNKETGGFEVASNARKELAQQIKVAIRSQKRTPRIYRIAKKHSFMDIPLIPIEQPSEPEDLEINTVLTVKTLNKEQGIHWIKAERLPAFLESELYLEYRLSRLLSQARITGDDGEYLLMKIDFKPRVKKVKKKKVQEVLRTNPKAALMKDMYVCMGSAGTTETDTWYTTAKSVHDTDTTCTFSRPCSGITRPKSGRRPTSARPASAYSEPYLRTDSGMGSSVKSSARGGSYRNVYESKYSVNDTEEEILMSKLFSADGKTSARISEAGSCAVSKDHADPARPFSSTVYRCPKDPLSGDLQLDDSELGIIDTDKVKADHDDEKDSGKGDDEMGEGGDLNDSAISDSDQMVFSNIEEIGSVIVSIVLKHAIEILTDKKHPNIDDILKQQNVLPNKKYSNLTLENLDKIVLEEKPMEPPVDGKKDSHKTDTVAKQVKKTDDESDVDSLLDSEEDYEESDTFFRKHKNPTYNLCSRRGIDQFKRFLRGTNGEKNWGLWLDIDRMRLMTNQEEIQAYLCALREKYHSPGADFELTVEQKIDLGLTEPSSWTLDKLMNVQNDIVEPLILYWAPRFLLKQLTKPNPEKSPIYQQQKQLRPVYPSGAYPNPPTATLLPLRPKTCHPRVQTTVMEEIPPVDQLNAFYPEDNRCDGTSPPVGMKRNYSTPTIDFLDRWNRERKSASPEKQLPVISPREKTSTPRLRSSASGRSGAISSRSKSTLPLRRSSVTSTSSRISVESATGRVRIKSPKDRARSAHQQISLQLPSEVRGSSARLESRQSHSRRSSVASSISSVKSVGDDSESSEFFGGRRMETLLQALHHESESGKFFGRFIERSGNMLWINNLHFWCAVQDYHLLFYARSLDPYVVQKKAKAIYSQYIVVRAPHHVQCETDLCQAVYQCLDPPFEELFDEVEEYSIAVLYEAWQDMLDIDMNTYKKVELIDVKRHLETKSKYVLNLQKRGLIKERVSTPDVMEGYEDPIYDESLVANIPEAFKDYGLEKLIHNRIELEHFRNFLADNYASMDIMCWMDIEAFRRIPHTEERRRDSKAKEMKTKYLNKKYFFGPNSPAGKDGQDKVMDVGGGWGKLLEDRPPNAMILEAQKYVQERLEKKWLPLFLVTPDFDERQKPRLSMDDAVDDVLVQKRKKSQAVWKLLESKWVSSSKEIIMFRKALVNPVTSLQFRRYASIKGDSLENDVLFWLEVQKFKDMYHAHNDDTLILQKISTIINCFIESQLPPTLQVDIPQEVADKIVDRKYERSPYLFREAQLIIFRVLFAHWLDFCEFRSNMAEERIMPLIERRRKHAKAKERQKQLELEEKQAKRQKEADRRAALGLPPLGENEDIFHDPFKSHASDSVEGEQEEIEERDKISFTYSNYVSALEKEELLNNTDETSFTSLLTDADSVKDNDGSDKSSVHSKQSLGRKDSKVDGASQTTEIKKKSVRININGRKPDDGDQGAGRGKRKESKDSDSTARKSSVDGHAHAHGDGHPVKQAKTEGKLAHKLTTASGQKQSTRGAKH